MDSLISRILQKQRGGTPQTPPDAMAQQALVQPTVADQGVPMNPMVPNPNLEQAAVAQGGQIPLNPWIQQIMQHMGMMNFIRNRMNNQVLDPTAGG